MWLIVVRRHREFTYETLQANLGHDPRYTILWDRRYGERRILPNVPLLERRRAERRRSRARWSALGFVVTRRA